MNETNLKYLKEAMKFKGFTDESLQNELEQNIKKGVPDFQLSHEQKFQNDAVDYKLNFKKGTDDTYFFNKYQATLKNAGGPGNDRSHSFYIQNGTGFTIKEAYNLLAGRAVKKNLVRKMTSEEQKQYKAEFKLSREQRGLPENWEKAPTYNAWVQLNLEERDEKGQYKENKYTDNYGYDLKEAVNKFPIIDLQDSAKQQDLLKSLEKGNAQAVFFDNGNNQKDLMYLAANPQYKNVNVYDGHMKPVFQENKQAVAQDNSQKQAPAPAEKKQANKKVAQGENQQNRQRRRKGIAA